MYLDLHEIIEVPGRSVPFSCELDARRLSFPALCSFDSPVTARGTVKNTAGILELNGMIRATATVQCDLCAEPFSAALERAVQATLSEDPDSAEADDLFPLTGDGVDVSDVLETCFILETDLRYLCRPDCKGLCPTCGANLNHGPCGCKTQTDPRMAVLGQLLDTEE